MSQTSTDLLVPLAHRLTSPSQSIVERLIGESDRLKGGDGSCENEPPQIPLHLPTAQQTQHDAQAQFLPTHRGRVTDRSPAAWLQLPTTFLHQRDHLIVARCQRFTFLS